MTERDFILEGFTHSVRCDGRENSQTRKFKAVANILPNSLGSAEIYYADGKKLVCAISGEITVGKGTFKIFIESIVESNPLIKANLTKLIKQFIEPFVLSPQANDNLGWNLFADVLLYSPMSPTDADYIVLGLKKAYGNIELPLIKETCNIVSHEKKLEMVEGFLRLDESEFPCCYSMGVVYD